MTFKTNKVSYKIYEATMLNIIISAYIFYKLFIVNA